MYNLYRVLGMTGTTDEGVELYTASVGWIRDKPEKRFGNRLLRVVHSVGKTGYVLPEPGTPTSTGPLKTPTILFFFFHV